MNISMDKLYRTISHRSVRVISVDYRICPDVRGAVVLVRNPNGSENLVGYHMNGVPIMDAKNKARYLVEMETTKPKFGEYVCVRNCEYDKWDERVFVGFTPDGDCVTFDDDYEESLKVRSWYLWAMDKSR